MTFLGAPFSHGTVAADEEKSRGRKVPATTIRKPISRKQKIPHCAGLI
jgi:hypothetical protein